MHLAVKEDGAPLVRLAHSLRSIYGHVKHVNHTWLASQCLFVKCVCGEGRDAFNDKFFLKKNLFGAGSLAC